VTLGSHRDMRPHRTASVHPPVGPADARD
jgi:hypothetical protein